MELNDVLESKPLDKNIFYKIFIKYKNIFLYFGSKNPAPVQVFFWTSKGGLSWSLWVPRHVTVFAVGWMLLSLLQILQLKL